jgi:hypothetical protein
MAANYRYTNALSFTNPTAAAATFRAVIRFVIRFFIGFA